MDIISRFRRKSKEPITLIEPVAINGKGALKFESNFTVYFHQTLKNKYLFDIPVQTYLAYREKRRDMNNGNERYTRFVTPTDRYIHTITRTVLKGELGTAWKKDPLACAKVLVTLTNYLPYEKRENTFVRYPIESLCELNANCVDASVLGASMLSNAGIESCLIVYKKHMTLAIAVPAQGAHFIHEGTKYFFSEMTGGKWPGECTEAIGKPIEGEGDITKII